MTDFPDWQSPQAMAAANAAQLPAPTAQAIAAAGVPLLRGTNNLGFQGGQQWPALATTTLFNGLPITQPSYEGQFSLSFPAASGTMPFVRLTFNWTDSFSGLLVFSESFVITAGNGPANALTYYVRGPCHGDQLAVTAQNIDPTFTGAATWGINQTSHLWPNSYIIQSAYAPTAPNGFSNPSGNPAEGLIALTNPTIGASGSVQRLLAVDNSQADLELNAAGLPANIVYHLLDPAGLYSTINQADMFSQSVTAGARSRDTIQLPNGPVLLQLNNTSTNLAATPVFLLMRRKY